MLTLFTGMPGAGKTAAMVDLLFSELHDRPLYVDGVEGLKIPHFECDARKWHEELPDGAVLVVDEAQRVWRPRPAAAAVPPDIAAMETHRHKGIDIFMTTQNPRLIDSNVRALIGRHVHIRDVGVLGRHWYEWPECNDGLMWRSCTNHRSYKLPKHVFDLYKSASLHVKPIRGIPRAVWVGLGALLGILLLGYVVFGRIGDRFKPQQPSPSLPSPSPYPQQSDNGVFGAAREKKPIDDRVDWIPRVSNRPESAAAFKDVRSVSSMPVIKGGFCDKSGCRCFTNQGVDAGLTSSDCEPLVKHGRFDPYRLPLTAQSLPFGGSPSPSAKATVTPFKP